MSLKKLLGFQVRSPGGPGPLTLKEVEELEHLTQQLMQDMEHPQRQNVAVSGEPATRWDASPPSLCWPVPVAAPPVQASWPLTSLRPSSYLSLSSPAFPESCGRCHQPLARAQPAVRALGQLFHITCFTCHQCEQQLQGQQFYSLEGAPYCEGCYTVSPGLGLTGSAAGRRADVGWARLGSWLLGASSRPTSSCFPRTPWRSATPVGSPSLTAC